MNQALSACINSLLGRVDMQLIRRSFLESLLRELTPQHRLKQRLESQVAFLTDFIQQTANDNAGSETLGFMRFYAQHHDISHSQWSQDIFVMHATGSKRGGRYLEIGGADGVTGSNTLALRDHLGWTGVLVEPDPDQFRELSHNRPADRLVNAAISPTGGGGDAVLRQIGQLSCLEQYKPDDFHKAERESAKKAITVQTVDLTDLLKTMGETDYFSLDVEGAEYDILSSLHWDEITPPTILTVEHNHRDDVKTRLRTLLGKHGYLERFAECQWLTQGDLWFAHGGG